MSIQIAYGNVGVAEADHRIANNLANLSGVIRLQRNAISKSGRTFTTQQVCMLLDDIDARIEVTAKLHKSLAQAVQRQWSKPRRFRAGNFRDDRNAWPERKDGPDQSIIACDGYIDPRHALHAGLITAELLTNASKYAHPTGLPVKVHIRCETKDDGSFVVEVTDDGVGFPENFDPATDGGLGFQLMRALGEWAKRRASI